MQAKIKPKCCSKKLRRAVCDLGVDCSFEQASKKLFEHYNVDLCVEIIRNITERYAKLAREFNQRKKKSSSVAKQLIAESDGSMVPILEFVKGEEGRKKKNLFWKEFRLATIQRAGEVNWLYSVSHGSVDALGDCLAIIAQRIGLGKDTKVHALGDGAKWVYEQMERVFGCQVNFTIDFYHLCDYLSAAADIFGEGKERWLRETKKSLKQGKIKYILEELKKEHERYPDHKELMNCIKYIENRESQFAYEKAIANKLPIGSGKIESSHRNIIQQRMKKPGAWWKIGEAEDMINLRVLRANGDWNKFWEEESYESRAA